MLVDSRIDCPSFEKQLGDSCAHENLKEQKDQSFVLEFTLPRGHCYSRYFKYCDSAEYQRHFVQELANPISFVQGECRAQNLKLDS